MTPTEIKAEFAALPDEERRRCMRELQGDPEFAGFLPEYREAGQAVEVDTADSPRSYELGSATIPAPGPSWYSRLFRVRSPYVMASLSDGDYADNVEATLTDQDIATALYILAEGAQALKPHTAARHGGEAAILEALADIDVEADDWLDRTGATIQEASNLVVRVMVDHPYPSALAEKKTAGA
jgi:hypothetical protein